MVFYFMRNYCLFRIAYLMKAGARQEKNLTANLLAIGKPGQLHDVSTAHIKFGKLAHFTLGKPV